MSLGDLTAQNESDARTLRLCSKKRNEKVSGIRKALAFIFHPDFELIARSAPSYGHTARHRQGRICAIAYKIDEELIQLVPVRINYDFGAFREGHCYARFQSGNAPNPRAYIQGLA